MIPEMDETTGQISLRRRDGTEDSRPREAFTMRVAIKYQKELALSMQVRPLCRHQAYQRRSYFLRTIMEDTKSFVASE